MGIVLDELYTDGERHHGSQLDQEICKRLEYLSASYKNLWGQESQSIGLQRSCHAFCLCLRLCCRPQRLYRSDPPKTRRKSPIFSNRSLRLSCLGGGPGSDIIGVLKYLNEFADSEPVEKVGCYLLDKEQAWADAWTEIDDSFRAGVALTTNFQPLNVANPRSWKSQRKFLQADLFTLSYFVSEVLSVDGDGSVSCFWRQLFEEAKPNAMFLYVDNEHHAFNSYFDKLWKEAGLKSIIVKDNVRFTPNSSEQASELVKYQAKFNNRSPRIQATLSYRVLRKPE